MQGENMATMIVRLRVADFDGWAAVFDGMAAARREHGIVASSVHRDADDRNVVVTILRAATVDGLRNWGGSAALQEAMAEAGVKGAPEVQYLEDVA
jgi:hypothetical protein